MMQLSRAVRFALTPGPGGDSPISNSWAGWPATGRIVPQLTLVCVVRGQPDPQTGYVCNIRDIDELIRQVITEDIDPDGAAGKPAERLLQQIQAGCLSRWKLSTPICKLALHVSAYLNYAIDMERPEMIRLTEQFEFSAAHRLHSDELSPDANREFFGKCNNPAGHGHNYVVEVSVESGVESSEPIVSLPQFEATVKRQVIDRLDHKHLNEDVEYFSRVNPSVENIAKAIWEWLDGQFGDARLANVRVYETPKTWADYAG